MIFNRQKFRYPLKIFDKNVWCVKTTSKGSIGQAKRS